MNKTNFGSEFNDNYLVVVNGSEVKKAFINKKQALRYAIRCSLVSGRYVELWYQHSNGSCVLCRYWN